MIFLDFSLRLYIFGSWFCEGGGYRGQHQSRHCDDYQGQGPFSVLKLTLFKMRNHFSFTLVLKVPIGACFLVCM